MPNYASPNHSTHQRIAQATGVAVDPLMTDHLADAIQANFSARISDLDLDPDAIALADYTIAWWHYRSHLLGSRPDYQGTPTGTSLFALFAFDPEKIHVLHELDSWESLALSTIPDGYRCCDVEAATGCDSSDAKAIIGVKHWDYVCIYRICEVCQTWFTHDAQERLENRQPNFAAWPYTSDRMRVWKPEDTDSWS